MTAVPIDGRRVFNEPARGMHDTPGAERRFWSLGRAWANHVLTALEDARRGDVECIVGFPTSKRLYHKPGYRCPDRFEADHTPAVAV